MITLNLYICENCIYNNECENEDRQRIRLTTGIEVIATCKCQKEGQFDWLGRKLCSVDKTEVSVEVPAFEVHSSIWYKKVHLSKFLEDIGFEEVRNIRSHSFSEVLYTISKNKGTFIWGNNIV